MLCRCMSYISQQVETWAETTLFVQLIKNLEHMCPAGLSDLRRKIKIGFLIPFHLQGRWVASDTDNSATQAVIFLNSVSSSDSCTPRPALQECRAYLIAYALLPVLCSWAQTPFRGVDRETEA